MVPLSAAQGREPHADDDAAAAERGEHWWPVATAILAVAVMHAALPVQYRSHPRWLVPAVLVVLLGAMIVGDPGRIDRQRRWLRVLTAVVIAFITVANLYAALHLVHDILNNNQTYANHPGGLLASGAVIWATNVIAFGLWYWDLDRGGAAARAHREDRPPAFVFPEMQSKYADPAWEPTFIDYLSLAFWTATAFSPTDVSAIRPWAKSLMMVEASASLVIAALVIARAINVL